MEYVGPREADAEDDSPWRPLKEGAGKRRLSPKENTSQRWFSLQSTTKLT